MVIPEYVASMTEMSTLKEANPVFYSFVEKYYTEAGGQTGVDDRELREGKEKTFIQVEVETVRHFLGQMLSVLRGAGDFYLYALSKNKPQDDKVFFEKMDVYREEFNSLIQSVPDDVWLSLVRIQGLDPQDEHWRNIGNEFRRIANELKTGTDPVFVAQKAVEFFELFSKLTSKFARFN